MKMEELAGLVEFNYWANGRIVGAVEGLSPKQFTRELGSSFSSVRDTLAHIVGVEWVWLERLQGRSPGAIPTAREYADVVALRARWKEVESTFQEYLGR